MNYAAITETFTQLALEAGDLIMQVYASPDFEVKSKSDESPVTEADEKADAHISAGLRAAFPDLPLVTEEQAGTHSQQVSTFLIVDPLDGTKEFVNRRGEFTVNIALVEDGVPTHGVVYAPALGRLFRTTASGGAEEMNVETKATTPISVSTPDMGGLNVVASKSHRDQATDDYIGQYQVADFLSAGSSLKFCLVATGEADLYPRLGRTMEWDTAAGDAVLRAAGGHVDKMEGGGPLPYGKSGFANPFFVCYAPGVDVKPL
ncbi:3'(2'),5'-bisphosphate nucleotidase CysQ [Albimonas sp. CAU 1670]|uniref:3'(2'),5'-bisphosphate nucleotidase CysQ n=1 Tax=Albimonas sp. CAU 1670 TaxID=3032599 RepID=UPI0023DBCD72|nr:3'(2'),5'-bisphosphate nucleotidase CysQ [Albimonas sp. CAU 1670]MDF2232472.1 3'(2'),5'-bisphosphate nucleotidase CysQ [Albimonas sp. CAU 1670]